MNNNHYIQPILEIMTDREKKEKIKTDPEICFLIMGLYEKIQDLYVIEDLNKRLLGKKNFQASLACQHMLLQAKREIHGLTDIVIQLIKQYQYKPNL